MQQQSKEQTQKEVWDTRGAEYVQNRMPMIGLGLFFFYISAYLNY
jgi:hypothetical protein